MTQTIDLGPLPKGFEITVEDGRKLKFFGLTVGSTITIRSQIRDIAAENKETLPETIAECTISEINGRKVRDESNSHKLIPVGFSSSDKSKFVEEFLSYHKDIFKAHPEDFSQLSDISDRYEAFQKFLITYFQRNERMWKDFSEKLLKPLSGLNLTNKTFAKINDDLKVKFPKITNMLLEAQGSANDMSNVLMLENLSNQSSSFKNKDQSTKQIEEFFQEMSGMVSDIAQTVKDGNRSADNFNNKTLKLALYSLMASAIIGFASLGITIYKEFLSAPNRVEIVNNIGLETSLNNSMKKISDGIENGQIAISNDLKTISTSLKNIETKIEKPQRQPRYKVKSPTN